MKAWFSRKCTERQQIEDWSKVSLWELMMMARSEMKELALEMNRLNYGGRNYDEIIDECADVANRMMMIADNAKGMK